MTHQSPETAPSDTSTQSIPERITVDKAIEILRSSDIERIILLLRSHFSQANLIYPKIISEALMYMTESQRKSVYESLEIQSDILIAPQLRKILWEIQYRTRGFCNI